jgi:hypothetical protein
MSSSDDGARSGVPRHSSDNGAACCTLSSISRPLAVLLLLSLRLLLGLRLLLLGLLLLGLRRRWRLR